MRLPKIATVYALLFCGLLIPATCSAQEEDIKVCLAVPESDYEILDYSVDTDDEASRIVDEFGVLYHLGDVPEDYEIPTELKSFTVENGISGVVVVSSFDLGTDGAVANLIRTTDGKIVLMVSDNIAPYPKQIVKTLMRITNADEAQRQEMKSVMRVSSEEHGWQAKFARAIQGTIDGFMGEETGSAIDYDKVYVEAGGSFGSIFGEDRMTLTIRSMGPYNIDVLKLPVPITTISNIDADLVLKIIYLDQYATYEEKLYIGDDGVLYACR